MYLAITHQKFLPQSNVNTFIFKLIVSTTKQSYFYSLHDQTHEDEFAEY